MGGALFVVFLQAIIFHQKFIIMATIAELKEAIQQKKDSINAILTNSPYTPIASEAPQGKYEDILAALTAAEDKLLPLVE